MAKRRYKILIVEDEEFILDMYQVQLVQVGYEVAVATNGDEGITKARAVHPDLILLDILMPKVDGYDMLRQLKQEKETKDIPIIIFSNLSQREEIEKGLKLGAQDFILKTSVTPGELADRVTDFLEKLTPKPTR